LVPKAGGSDVVLASISNALYCPALAVDGETVFWSARYPLHRTTPDGTTDDVATGLGCLGNLGVMDGQVFWTDAGHDSGTWAVRSAPLDAPSQVHDWLTPAGVRAGFLGGVVAAPAVHALYVGEGEELFRIDIPSGRVQPFYEIGTRPANNLAVDDAYLYVLEGTMLEALPHATGLPHTLAVRQPY